MPWKIDAALMFPHFMNPSDYDAGASVYDWFKNGAPQLDEVYPTKEIAKAAVAVLRRYYRGKDVHGVSCRLTVVETER